MLASRALTIFSKGELSTSEEAGSLLCFALLYYIILFTYYTV